MAFFKLSVLFVIFIECGIRSYALAVQNNGICQLTIPVDVPKNEPVYLIQHGQNNFTLFEPNGASNYFSTNENLFLFCPGRKNAIQIEGQVLDSSLTVSCGNANFQINDFGDINNLNEINCTKGVQADISVKEQEKCSTTGYIADVGFKLTTLFDDILLPTFKVCFDNTTLTPIWSKHIINGKSIKFNVKESTRREFRTTGYPTDAQPEIAYKRATQLIHFTELIGQTQTEAYFRSSSYLARGHLTPDADFVFPSAQFSTYFYLNTCPQFQSVNAGNWLRVESLARKLAQHYDVGMEIFTGGYDNLKLEDSNGNLKSMYLTADEKYKVPKWIWKIIKNPSTDSAIVMITLNDPLAREDEVEEFCTNVCDKAYLNSIYFKAMHRGYTFCCEVMDFRRVVLDLPPDATAGNLLSGSGVGLDD